ncbi:MAG: sulfatase [Synoicihabitans sp.]
MKSFRLLAYLTGAVSLVFAAASASATKPEIRNVLLLVADDLKATTLGVYGDEIVKTPNIDQLAREGMVFHRGYCQGTYCRPSRRSFMRSRYADEIGLTMGEHFIEHGYYSARVGKIFHMRVPGDIVDGTDGEDVVSTWTERFNSSGLEAHTPGLYSLYNHDITTTRLENRVSTAQKHRWFVSVESAGDGSDQPDFKTATKTIELLRQRAHTDQPFFIAAGFVRPHYPNVAPAEYFDLYPADSIPLPETREGDLDDVPQLGQASVTSLNDPIGQYPENQKKFWGSYYSTVTFLDDQIGRVMAELDRQGLRESTLVIFFSDHGYHLGEHFFWQKHTLHEDVTRVPFVISAPGYAPGESMSLVELVDIFPTIADLVGLPIPETVQGESLVETLKDPKATVREAAFTVGNRDDYALRGHDWAYLRYRDGSEELYDMRMDPKQFTNLANNPAYADALQSQRAKLDARIKTADLSRE